MSDNDSSEEADGPLKILKAQQNKERKEMRAKITALKHAIPKNNVKKKKEVMQQVEQMENELKKRHDEQLLGLEKTSEDVKIKENEEKHEETNQNSAVDSVTSFFKEIKLSKSQQKKENKRKEQEAKRLEASQKDQESAVYSKSYKENEAIKQLLKLRNLKLKDIPPDAEDLRIMAAKFIKKNKKEFLGYLINSEGNLVDEESFDDYYYKVKHMCSKGGDWGGEPEIRALSENLNVCIQVLNADGTINKFGDDDDLESLLLTYHRHAYSLGEHYNSTEPSTVSEFDEFELNKF
uniref:OTU domain-containing protein n=1 Tax=Meloidogyne javanica TaxID=6303 RepID=A0A915N7N0_MELJA